MSDRYARLITAIIKSYSFAYNWSYGSCIVCFSGILKTQYQVGLADPRHTYIPDAVERKLDFSLLHQHSRIVSCHPFRHDDNPRYIHIPKCHDTNRGYGIFVNHLNTINLKVGLI